MRASVSLFLVLLAVGCGGATARTTARVSQAHLAGNQITLDDHINFETDSAVIVADSHALIEDIATVLTSHSEITTLHVVGHTDSTGDDAHNLELSAARAEAVASAMREHGVTQTIDARGAGETEPLCTEETDACHATNRRVELLVEAN
jgi:outer membrane protein OmpA-like peptidoglycan-associated protein